MFNWNKHVYEHHCSRKAILSTKPANKKQWRNDKKNLPANAGVAGDAGSMPELRRSPGEGNGNLLQYSCLENSMARGA